MALPIRQIAYFVPDVRVAAARHAALFGSGPYFVAEHIPLRKALYRGREGRLDHSSAYGQWGELMVEFVQQNNPGPSAFHDMYPEGSGRGGIHDINVQRKIPARLPRPRKNPNQPRAARSPPPAMSRNLLHARMTQTA